MQGQTKKTTRRNAKQSNPVSNPVQETIQEQDQQKEMLFTEEQVRKMIAEAVSQYAAENAKPASSADGTVTMFFQAEVNDANEVFLGPNGKYGVITGKHATITIPHRDFVGDFRTTTMQYFLKNRNLIVVDGLTDDERRVYGLDYQQGEYLEPAVYDRLIEMGDKVVDIFPKLHKTWREMIAQKFAEAFENKKLKCSREALLKLNQISKKDYEDLPSSDIRHKGGFYAIIRAMNAADEEGDAE